MNTTGIRTRPTLIAALAATLILGALIGGLLTPPAGHADLTHSVLVVTQPINGGEQITGARLETRRVTDVPAHAVSVTRRDAIATQVAALILPPGHVLTDQDITAPLPTTALATLRVATSRVPAGLRLRRSILVAGPNYTYPATVVAIRSSNTHDVTVVDVDAESDALLMIRSAQDQISITAIR